jgi:PBSX family phage terminase large subunit
MHDNPILSPTQIADAEALYSGVFYDRYIQGKWCAAEGLVYPMFDAAVHTVQNYQPSNDTIYYISIDYGTVNPCSMGLWALEQDRAVRIKEAYYGARATGQRRTDEQHYQTLLRLADGYNIQQVVVDPSAASFITLIRQEGRFSVRPANNSVLDGVRLTGSLLSQNRILFSDTCKDSIREFHLYRWDETKTTDTVIKENDHAMDDIRYFCCTILQHTQWADKGGGKNDYKKRH